MNKILILDEKISDFRLEEVEDIELSYLQNLVDGYIECIPTSRKLIENNIVCIANEEGKLKGKYKPVLEYLNKTSGEVLDIVVGNIVFLGKNEADFIGLTDNQIDITKKEIIDSKNTYISKKNPKDIMNIKSIYID